MNDWNSLDLPTELARPSLGPILINDFFATKAENWNHWALDTVWLIITTSFMQSIYHGERQGNEFHRNAVWWKAMFNIERYRCTMVILSWLFHANIYYLKCVIAQSIVESVLTMQSNKVTKSLTKLCGQNFEAIDR